MSIIKENNAELLEIGEIKTSKLWTNLFLKFRFENGEERWLYYSEHINKPERLKQIMDLADSNKYAVGDTVTVSYKIVQSPNKSTKLSIFDISNHRRK